MLINKRKEMLLSKEQRTKYGIDPKPIIKQAELISWSNSMIAEAAKVSSKSVYRWKKNINSMNSYSADNLCTALGMPFSMVYPYA